MLESVNFAEDITVTVGVIEANVFFVNCTGPKGITAVNDFSVGDIGLVNDDGSMNRLASVRV